MKPDSAVVIKCIKSLRTTSNVMIGDRTEDIEAGKLANCVTIGLTQSSHSKKDLSLADADLVLPKLGITTTSIITEMLSK